VKVTYTNVRLPALRVLVVASLLGSGGSVGAEPPGKLCFERGEAEGPIKKHPVRILGELDGRSRKVADLRGTKKVCASVPAGKWSLEVRSTSPLDPRAKDPNACRSAPFIIDVPKGETVTVWVTPVGRNGVYHCGWELN
jgi:hypothetical protein